MLAGRPRHFIDPHTGIDDQAGQRRALRSQAPEGQVPLFFRGGAGRFAEDRLFLAVGLEGSKLQLLLDCLVGLALRFFGIFQTPTCFGL